MLVKPATAQRPHGVSCDHPGAYRFGSVEVDFHAGELRRSGMRIRIQDQPLHVLWLLVRHVGEVVTREELRELLWPADTFVDFDHGLNSAMKRLRDALGDDPEKPRLIETIPRHGYRFIAPVEQITAGSTANRDLPPSGGQTQVDNRPPAGRAKVVARVASTWSWRSGGRMVPHLGWIAVIATLVVILLLAVHKLPARPHVASARPPVTLAVLPFRDLGGDPSHNLVADGMTQEVITHLGKLDSTRAVLRALRPLQPGNPAKESAANKVGDAGVEYLLNGSIQLQGNRLRITVQLIKTSDQSYVWVESYDDSTDDVLHTQADVAAQIAAVVSKKLTR